MRGYPLSEALTSASFSLEPKRRVELLKSLKALEEGYPLYKIFEKLNFNKDLVGYVYFAEQSGQLAKSFIDGSTMILKWDNHLKKLKNLLVYPAFLLFVTSILFFFIEKFLIPRFGSLFQTMNLESNLFSTIVFFVGDSLPKLFLLFLASLLSVFLYYVFFFKRRSQLDRKRILVQVPFMGGFLKLLYSHYFSVQLSYLLAGGFSVHHALSQFGKNNGQPLYKEIGLEIKQKLLIGEKFEDIVSSFSFFEQELTFIIKHGQDNGRLDQELYFYSEHCMKRLEELIGKWLKIIQPAVFVIIGSIILSLYLAIMLPMFHLLNGI